MQQVSVSLSKNLFGQKADDTPGLGTKFTLIVAEHAEHVPVIPHASLLSSASRIASNRINLWPSVRRRIPLSDGSSIFMRWGGNSSSRKAKDAEKEA